ncbi:MAG: hypothetical protein JWN48_4014 [Myxococcaceae bacterium]|nr:hypothetical protein [Myxococcaceae bacterium]
MERASFDPRCSARIVARREMLYREGEDAALDRPAHVRAASSLAWVGERLAVVQDDANFIALVEPQTGQAEAVTLPAGHGDKRQFDDLRGTKRFKLDLEACFSVVEPGQGSGPSHTRLFALGSGTKRIRECVVIIDFAPDDLTVSSLRVVDARAFYAQLHGLHQLVGGELNLEGALVRGDSLLLFQRGNGATREGRASISAIGELSWSRFQGYLAAAAENESPLEVPPLRSIAPYDLGQVDGVPLSFTDATPGATGELVFLASAEASTDSTTDGAVVGTRVGLIAADGSARMATLEDEAGRPTLLKAEGIVLDRHDASRAWVVVDMDDPVVPSLLLEVRLHFP